MLVRVIATVAKTAGEGLCKGQNDGADTCVEVSMTV